MKILFKNLSVLICWISLLPLTAAQDTRQLYATVMQHDTQPEIRINAAVNLYNILRNREDILLNLTKHLVAKPNDKHHITAYELMNLSDFHKKIVWTLYPTNGGTEAVRDIVVFAQKLYSIKGNTKNIDLALNSIEAGNIEETLMSNAILALESLKELCLSYTNLVHNQLDHNQATAQIIRNLAFAIYNIKEGNDVDPNVTREDIDISLIDNDNLAPLANVTEERLRELRNILISEDLPTSGAPLDDFPEEKKCIFFITISESLKPFFTTYLVPCVRTSLKKLTEPITNNEATDPVFEVPNQQRKQSNGDYTSFTLQKTLYMPLFTYFLSGCRNALEDELIPHSGISIISDNQLLKKDDGTPRLHAKNTIIKACFKACTPIIPEANPQIPIPQHFQMETTTPPRIRQVTQNPYFATFSPVR